MVKTQYFTATSADGFIAAQNDSLEWLFEVPRDHDDGAWEDFIAGVSVMAMGATTYEWVLDHDDLLENPGTWQEYYGDRGVMLHVDNQLRAVRKSRCGTLRVPMLAPARVPRDHPLPATAVWAGQATDP
jgi:dihydrofolate reductase